MDGRVNSLAAYLLVMPQAVLAATGAALPPALYSEPLRPQYHFTPAANWINDPNGLVYLDGEYHLFFQYNPQGDRWGHMSWGHAVSADLVHWRELPVAIPEDDRYMIFSGSVVVDSLNSSGFGSSGAAPLVAIYTGAEHRSGGLQNQQLAYSLDRGRSWTKYAGNPVLDLGSSNFHDPKVFWYAPASTWIMAAVLSDRHQVALFSSGDLKHWTHLSDFGPAGASDGAWECPDLFPLRVNGNAADLRWVLKVDVFRSAIAAGSGAQYFIGEFDGTEFHAESEARWLDYGMDFYAAASWAHLPDAETRHVWIAWMNSHHYAQEIPTAPWRGAMTLPREVSLRSESGALALLQAPVAALTELRGRHSRLGRLLLTGEARRVPKFANDGKQLEILVQFAPRSAQEFGLKVDVGKGEETVIGYDAPSATLFVDRSHSGKIPAPIFAERRAAPLEPRHGLVKLHIFLDRSSVEIFANDGERVITEQLFASANSDGIELYAKGGTALLQSLDLWEMHSAVPRATADRR
jgi:fructan beta-fructosidase